MTQIKAKLNAAFATTDAQLFGVHVPRPGTCEGVQHEPHYTEALAGKRATADSFDLKLFRAATERKPIFFLSWFQLAIQENYRNNPFHNFRHCFCVSQMMYGMIHLCNLQVAPTPNLTHMLYAIMCIDGRIGSCAANFAPNLSLKCL